MSLFGIFGEVLRTPLAIVKDVANVDNKGSETTNTGQRWEDLKDEVSDMFNFMD